MRTSGQDGKNPAARRGFCLFSRAGGPGRQRNLREDDGDGTLPIGQRVRHAVFGEGTVLDVDLNKGAHVIQFDGMGTPRSISLRAKLEKIGP